MDMLITTPQWDATITAWEQWLRAAQLSPGTRGQRTYHLRSFAHHHPHREPHQVTVDDLVAWLADHDWRPNTRRSHRASHRTFFAWLHGTGRAGTNPAVELPAVRVPRAVPRPASDDVVVAAVRAAPERERLMVLIMSETGVRRGECASVHTSDVEVTADGWALRVIGKGGSERLVPITGELAGMIRRRPAGWVFPGQINGHLSPSYVGKLVSALLGPGVVPHQLRHRFGTVAYRHDHDVRVVQELLGHANLATVQVYTQVSATSRRSAAMAAAALTSGLLGAA